MDYVSVFTTFLDKNGFATALLLLILVGTYRIVTLIIPELRALGARYLDLIEARNKQYEESIKQCQQLQQQTIDALTALRLTLSASDRGAK